MDVVRRRRALVTGASAGIGRAVAVELGRSGFDVALLARRRAPMEALADRLRLQGKDARVLACDLADRRATDGALDELAASWDRIDVLVLNAGTWGPTPLDAPDTGAFDRQLEVNLTSVFRVVRRLLPHVPEGGRIVTVASVLARFGVPSVHGYGAAKAGVVGFTRALALELAPRGILVNAVLPGWVDTSMAASSIEAQALQLGTAPEAARATFESAVPLGRFLEPAEVARAIGFLVSPRATGITGQAINVCGGTMA